jgi:hypothetical protein
MRELTITEIAGVSGGRCSGDGVAVCPAGYVRDACGNCYEVVVVTEALKKLSPYVDTVKANSVEWMAGWRFPPGVGPVVSPSKIGASVGKPGPVLTTTTPEDPNNPEVEVDVGIDDATVTIPTNTSQKAREDFWFKAFGTPPNAVPRY